MGRMLIKARERVQDALQWLWQQEGTPGQRARGLAAGIFCGCFPFFGFQTLLGIALASVVRGNHLLAAAGTWISNPFTYVPLYWFNFRVGSLVLGPGRPWPGFDAVRQEGFSDVGGAALALAGGAYSPQPACPPLLCLSPLLPATLPRAGHRDAHATPNAKKLAA